MLNVTFTLLKRKSGFYRCQFSLPMPNKTERTNKKFDNWVILHMSKSLIGSAYFPFHMSILLQQVFRIGIFKLVSIQVFLTNYFKTLL